VWGLVYPQGNSEFGQFALSISQRGSSLTATTTTDTDDALAAPDGSRTTTQSCTYTGTATWSDTVALNATSCQPSGLQVQCANGVLRDIYLVTRSVTGTVITNPGGTTMNGTIVDSWNVFVHGTATNTLGVLAINYGLTTRR